MNGDLPPEWVMDTFGKRLKIMEWWAGPLRHEHGEG